MKLRSLCLTIGSAFLLAAAPIWAQDNGLKTVDTRGTVEEHGGYQLKIKDKAGKELNIFVDPTSSTLSYTGTADSKLLSPGMMVRFSGSFDAKGNSQSDLKELEVFRPKVGVQMMQDELMSQTPGIYPIEDKKNGPADKNSADKNPAKGAKDDTPPSKGSATNTNSKNDKATKGSSKQRPNNKTNNAKSSDGKSGAEFHEYKIVGQITSVQGNKLQVNTGSQSIVVPLAANSKIKILMPDAELAVKGDEVHVIGLSNAAQPDAVQAKIVNITGAKPLAPQQMDEARKPGDKSADSKKDTKSKNSGNGKTAGKQP